MEKLSEAAVDRCSLKQLFLKITVKKTPVLECLFNKFAGLQVCIFMKKRLQHRCFLKKFLRTAFFCRILTVHYTFSKLYVMIEGFGRLWVQNCYFSYFLCHSFDFLNGYFHTKILSKCKFRTCYNGGSSTILQHSSTPD